mgnify:CR=1 FL=1
MKQTRWICEGCGREWLTADEHYAQPRVLDARGQSKVWEPADGCPRCHHAGIKQVVFDPSFPGGDIPRSDLLPLFAISNTAPVLTAIREQPNMTLAVTGAVRDLLNRDWAAPDLDPDRDWAALD